MLAGLAACTPPPLPPTARVTIAPDLSMILPSPSELGRDLHAVHLVTARHDDRVVSFEGHLDVTDGRLMLAVLDPLGRKALTVVWTGPDIVTDAAAWFPAELPPRNILADLVLIYWPPEVLQRALAPAHAAFEAMPRHRAVLRDGAEVISADFAPLGAGERVRYRNIGFGYSLDIRAAEQVP
jgi:Protein of unknown function (DUF3261)